MPQTVIDTQQAAPMIPYFQGKTGKITLPSGRVLTIREPNGDDEDILSKVSDSLSGENVGNFLSSIIEHDSLLNAAPTPGHIKDWLINDKYYALFKQRLFNHGTELKFEVKCTNTKCEHVATYTEDLSRWDGDLSDPNYTPTNKEAITKYIKGNEQAIEFDISSGKKLKFKRLDSNLEKIALELKDTSKNSSLIVRDLHVQNQNQWIKVTHFAIFSSKEMREIHKEQLRYDTQFEPLINFECEKCLKAYSYSVFQLPAFFFPEELI